MNTIQAKKEVAAMLADLDLPPHRLTARTVDFTDLARERVVFVTIHNWSPNPKASILDAVAREMGFRIQFS